MAVGYGCDCGFGCGIDNCNFDWQIPIEYADQPPVASEQNAQLATRLGNCRWLLAIGRWLLAVGCWLLVMSIFNFTLPLRKPKGSEGQRQRHMRHIYKTAMGTVHCRVHAQKAQDALPLAVLLYA